MPSDLEFSWGLGNDQTCQTAGFLINIGAMTVLKYLCKLKYRMTNESFSARFEWKLHVLFILIGLVLAICCVAMDLFKPMFSRSYCQIGYTPTGCQYFPQVVGECENNAKPKGEDLVESLLYATVMLCFIGIIICMGMLLWQEILEMNLRIKQNPGLWPVSDK